ncbi:phosphotransferase family protein [Neobacillus muris]|uniref:phosphotransferase family protein n=1 Tax=Neobacillus muris TaxID=2941334 RepID=UPI00203E5539|nr:phosphotransferase family protein [Neobacillus muris]
MRALDQSVANEPINWDELERLVRHTVEEIPEEPMKIIKFSEGYSNHTYLLTIGDWEAVLRRPPFGEIPAKAHDIKREYTILSRLHGFYPLAPKPYFYKDDPNIMERHFYLMEKKQGVVVNDSLPVSYGSSEMAGPKISKGLIDSLIELQQVDFKKANLLEIGKPEGYLERQVHGWIKRYRASKTDEILGVAELENWLIRHMPASPDTTIVHNDFKLNNLVLDPEKAGVVKGVLDWEMATLGDPMTDVGAVLTYWGEAGDPDMGISVVTNQPGFPSRREMAELYAQMSGRDISCIHYYLAFGFYKLAVILQQLHYRWKKGAAMDDRFAALNGPVANLIEMANLARAHKIL